MNILKFRSEEHTRIWFTTLCFMGDTLIIQDETEFEQWLLHNCAAIWHTGEIWVIV